MEIMSRVPLLSSSLCRSGAVRLATPVVARPSSALPQRCVVRRDRPTATHWARGLSAEAVEPRFVSYSVRRTTTKNLPVYTDYRNGGTRHLTIVRNVDGNVAALMDELRELTGAEVTEAVGRVEVKGIYSKEIKAYLRDLGF